MHRVLRCKFLQGGHLHDQLPRDPQASQPGTRQKRDCSQLPEEMSDKQFSECLFPTTASKPVYKMPGYAYVHKELQRSRVTLNLLWPVYYDQCRAAGEINTQQSIQLLRELGGTPAAAAAPSSAGSPSSQSESNRPQQADSRRIPALLQ